MISPPDWQFGGLLQALPKGAAWGALGAAAALGVAFIIFSYRHTLRELPPGRRRALTVLRAAVLLALLVCLANPSRVERSARKPGQARRLAVVLDRSGSMEMPDNRGETRLANSLRIWKPHIDEAEKSFSETEYFRFSTELEKAGDLAGAARAQPPGPETRLYEALDRLLDTRPGAIVCLTDGLDTTGAAAGPLTEKARRLGVPVYFAAGKNRLKASDQLSISEIRIPPSVLRQTGFSPGALVTITSREAREVPLELWSGTKLLSSVKLPVRPGMNSLNWSPKVTAGEPGAMPLEFRLGEGEAQEVAAGTTQIVARKTVNVLYYQGALQWGYRFLMAALESDASFKVSSILNPALRVRMTMTANSSQNALSDLPETAAGLKDFQIVVLAHVFADQLDLRQQEALVEYVRGGGGVLFIMPDTDTTLRFAGTPLEQMLPVVFESPAPGDRQDPALARFRSQLDELNGAQADDTNTPLHATERRQELPELKPFAVPPANRSALSAELFAQKDPPMFSDYAKVRSVKAAAEILAVHPDARDEGGRNPAVLLARQRFGDGFSAALATDLLWRWKMSLPSTSRAPEKFWQQLMLSLSSSGGRGLRLVRLTPDAAVNHAVELRVEGIAALHAPVVTATAPDGRQRPLPLVGIADAESGGWRADFTPDSAGRWQVSARDDSGNEARITVSVDVQARTVETSNLPPDIDGLRQVAEATGGALIGDQPVFRAPAAEMELPEIKQVSPLWNSRWMIGLLLGLYAIELITRRRFKLL